MAGLTPPAFAAGNVDALRNKVDALERELDTLKQELEEQKKNKASKRELARLEQKTSQASEWLQPNTLIHMAGYADVDFVASEDENSSFTLGSFSPIFHFQYRDLVMLESELEFELADNGETEVGLEYLTVDLFLNDYMTLVAGKFLSPLGQFRQNLHPSWINKIASAPPGFGHDGAAPTSETGLQLRGGFPLSGVKLNYALYVGNGPELNAETGDQIEFELEGVRAEGFGADNDSKPVYGGRIGILPIPALEIGFSGATGKATVTELEDDSGNPPLVLDETARDYDVYGADFNFFYRAFHLRGEYVKTKVGDANTGVTASDGAEWNSWYTQASWRFLPTKWEAVLRYADFESANTISDQKQWAIGLNYLFANNFMAKFTYEFNDGEKDSVADSDRFLSQLAYGF
ncbi:MAG TPA: hypothetical protein ENJ79_09030 [Gammaproteobacteria bacterium]|nr:hypothetical protein [Gammaproteobacteria bacterium]